MHMRMRFLSVLQPMTENMDDIMRTVTGNPTAENTGEPDLNKKLVHIPNNPQATLDLHGFRVLEGVWEAELFIKRCQKNELLKIRIITGYGSETGISLLFSHVGKRLSELESGYEKIKVERKKGFFDILLLP